MSKEPLLDIIYEDDGVIVVNKRSGLLVIPTAKDEKNTLTALIDSHLLHKGEKAKSHPCHRLDRDTSGVIVYSKGKSNQKKIMEQFHNKEVDKKYIAVVAGNVEKKSGVINYKIENKEAITKYNVIKSSKEYTVLEIELLTGRTNQIRIHFSMIGHPLLGETKFAFRKDFNIKAKKLTLHSKSISFIHPTTGERLTFEAKMPEHISAFF